MDRHVAIDITLGTTVVTLPWWVGLAEHGILFVGALTLLGIRLAIAYRDWKRGRDLLASRLP